MKATFTGIAPKEKIVFTSGALDAKGEVLFDILTTVKFVEIGDKLGSRLVHLRPGASRNTLCTFLMAGIPRTEASSQTW